MLVSETMDATSHPVHLLRNAYKVAPAAGFARPLPHQSRSVSSSRRLNAGRERTRLAVRTPGFATIPGWLPAS